MSKTARKKICEDCETNQVAGKSDLCASCTTEAAAFDDEILTLKIPRRAWRTLEAILEINAETNFLDAEIRRDITRALKLVEITDDKNL